MRVLLIKTSSMGDVLHTLPALTDAGKAIPGIQFDWVIEDPFKEIPAWHPLVNEIIPVSLRRWRKNIFAKSTVNEWLQVRGKLRATNYDLVLDAQGLIKSASVAYFCTKDKRAGLDWSSARESLASVMYQQKHTVNFNQHAVVRMRQLFSSALGYPMPNTAPDFGLGSNAEMSTSHDKYLVFLHATTWESKLWPEGYWLELANIAKNAGYRVKMGGGNAEEVARAERIAKECDAIDLVPYLSISAMASLLKNSAGAVAVDTGFGHLSGALGVPTVSIYGSTNPDYTGALGAQSVLLAPDFPCAPCLSRVCRYEGESLVRPACYEKNSPILVWGKLFEMLNNKQS